MAMSDKTPYWKRPAKEIEQEVACMRQIFRAARPVSFIYEAFGGVGATAAILREQFPTAIFHAFDLDARCCELYNRSAKGMALCVQSDAAVGLSKLNFQGGTLGAVLDFNRFTLLDFARPEGKWKRELLTAVMDRKPEWVEVTDSAVCYLKTNWKRYGLPEPTLAAYVEKLRVEFKARWRYDLKAWSNHRSATYTLWSRK